MKIYRSTPAKELEKTYEKEYGKPPVETHYSQDYLFWLENRVVNLEKELKIKNQQGKEKG